MAAVVWSSPTVVGSRPNGVSVWVWTGSLALIAAGAAFNVMRLWTIYSAGELFHRLGVDWAMFYAQAMLARAGAGSQIYDVTRIDQQLQALRQFYPGDTGFTAALQVPYPPWFAAMVLPFTLPSPQLGFGLWLAVSVACAACLAYRLKHYLPQLPGWAALALVLAAYPVAWGVFMGQVGLLVALAVSEMMVSLRAGRDFRAGMWLAVLLIKPQYAVLFGLLVLLKWRVRALVGTALGGLAFVLLGLVVVGPTAFLRFPSVLGEMADFRNPAASPWGMINWRALVLYAIPGISNADGVVLVSVLSALTIVFLLFLWRGPWRPSDPDFAPRFAALAVGALITSYHSHVHGAPLMIVPVAAAWNQQVFRFETRAAILACLYLPTLILIWADGILSRLSVPADSEVSLWLAWPDALPALLFVTAFLMICRDVWRPALLNLKTLSSVLPAAR
jgi:hypothetical protein